jgi:SAM-dependent methyltransferase
MTAVSRADIDIRNVEFWNELCGSGLARSIGITDHTPASLQKFDDAYMDLYPYLAAYVTNESLAGRNVLEIGLGYGTLGQLIASRGCRYHGLDIAPGPVAMMRYRLSLRGEDPGDRVLQGSALAIPFPDASVDYVYSIGCLHHTGDLPRAVSELHRILTPRGKAVVMLYHRHSLRQFVQIPARYLRDRLAGRRRYATFEEAARAYYDTNAAGDAAPHTDFVSRAQVRKELFRRFTRVRIDSQNFDTYFLFRRRMVLPREWFLNNLARVVGTDLYIVASK